MPHHSKNDVAYGIRHHVHHTLPQCDGTRKSVVTSPPAAAAAAVAAAGGTREYVHPRFGVTPSASVVLPPSETPHVSYSFRKEADNVVSMARGFLTIYIYADVVESHTFVAVPPGSWESRRHGI